MAKIGKTFEKKFEKTFFESLKQASALSRLLMHYFDQ